jgi:hypothetical protein
MVIDILTSPVALIFILMFVESLVYVSQTMRFRSFLHFVNEGLGTIGVVTLVGGGLSLLTYLMIIWLAKFVVLGFPVLEGYEGNIAFFSYLIINLPVFGYFVSRKSVLASDEPGDSPINMSFSFLLKGRMFLILVVVLVMVISRILKMLGF